MREVSRPLHLLLWAGLLSGAVGSAQASPSNPAGQLLGDKLGTVDEQRFRDYKDASFGDAGRKFGLSRGQVLFYNLLEPNRADRIKVISDLRALLAQEVARRAAAKEPALKFTSTTRDGKSLPDELSPSEFAALYQMLDDRKVLIGRESTGPGQYDHKPSKIYTFAEYNALVEKVAKGQMTQAALDKLNIKPSGNIALAALSTNNVRIVDQEALSKMTDEQKKDMETYRTENVFKVTRKVTPIFETRTIFYPN